MLKIEQHKKIEDQTGIQKGSVEGVIIVNGRPQIERADMPFSLSFDSIEDLERFCKEAEKRRQE